MTTVLEFQRLKEPEPKPRPSWKMRDMDFQKRNYCGGAFLPAEFCGCGQAEPHCQPCHFILIERGFISK